MPPGGRRMGGIAEPPWPAAKSGRVEQPRNCRDAPCIGTTTVELRAAAPMARCCRGDDVAALSVVHSLRGKRQPPRIGDIGPQHAHQRVRQDRLAKEEERSARSAHSARGRVAEPSRHYRRRAERSDAVAASPSPA